MAESFDLNGEENVDFAENSAEDFNNFEPVPNVSASSVNSGFGDSSVENGPPADPAASGANNSGDVKKEAGEEGNPQGGTEGVKQEAEEAGSNEAEISGAPITYGGAQAAQQQQSTFDESKFAGDERFTGLRAQNLDPKVAACMIALYDAEVFAPEDVDERSVEMLRIFRLDHSEHILTHLLTANLIGVQNKASFLMALMRNFRDRLRQLGPEATLSAPLFNGPERDSLQAILDRTGYAMEVTIGQRKYGGPPPDTDEGPAAQTAPGHEIYIGHIPKDMFEDELIPLFEEFGRIWDLRIMMDPMTGYNRGYGFVTYCEKESAKKAAEKFDGYEIKKGKKLKVNVSVANTRLFLGNIPKSKTKDEIMTELQSLTEGVREVIVYTSPDQTSNRRNRGFCFVDFVDHKTASDAKRRLQNGRIRPWNCDLVVDWAESQEEPDEETMSKVKVLYVRNLKEAVTDTKLKEVFEKYGELDRVKKVRDYAFVHFNERDNAVKALEELNGTDVDGATMEISLAKPQMDRSKRERMRMDRDRRGMGGRGRGMPGRGGYMDYYGGPPGQGSPGGRGRYQRGRGGPPASTRGGRLPQDYGGYGGYDYGYGGGYGDYGGYGSYGDHGYQGGYGYDDPYYGGYPAGGDPYYGQAGYDDYYARGYSASYDDYYSGYGQAAAPPPPPRGGRGGMGGYPPSGGRGRGGGGGGYPRGGRGGGRGSPGNRGANRGSAGRPFSRGAQKRKMEGGDIGGAKRMNDGGAAAGGGYIGSIKIEPMAQQPAPQQDWSADVDPNFG